MDNSRNKHPKDDPSIKRLLNKMPPAIAASFSTEQLFGLQHAITDRRWKAHKVDMRPTLKFPFLPWAFYFVFLMGHERRSLSDKEKSVAAASLLFLLVLVCTFILGVGLLFVYLLKSALGIDLFENSSLGIWDWFNS